MLTYGWVRSTYAALRNLRQYGIDVHVSDNFRTGMCQASNKKQSFDIYRSHYHVGEEEFVKDVKEICIKRNIDIIFPSHNETEVLSKHRLEFESDLGILFPDYTHCKIFNNKSLSYDFVEKLGISLPVRITYDHPSEIPDKFQLLGVSRCVIKLLTGNSSKGVFYANSGDEARTIVESLIHQHCLTIDRYPQIEEYVSGEGWGSSVLYWHGEKIAGFSHKRLREKVLTGGTSTLREAVNAPDLEDAAEKIFSHIGWHGLAMAEFKRCPQTGKFWFIEVNPRLWGSLPLAINAGVDFPYLAILCATSGPDVAREYAREAQIKYGWTNRWLLGDLMVAATHAASGRFNQAVHTLGASQSKAFDDVFLG